MWGVGESVVWRLKPLGAGWIANRIVRAADHPIKFVFVDLVKSNWTREWGVTAQQLRDCVERAGVMVG